MECCGTPQPGKRGVQGSAQRKGGLQNTVTPTKSAHAKVILPGISAFLTVVKFFAFDLLGRGGEGPDGALPIVQLLSGLLAELFAGDEFRHEIHVLSSVAVG